MKHILLMLILTHSTFAWAASDQSLLLTLTKTLHQSWNDDYIPLACSDNMIRLSKRLPLKIQKRAFIIHVIHKYAPHVAIYPKAPRLVFKEQTYKPQPWVFHALLFVHGKVMDLDYTNSPLVEESNLYFKKMWSQKELLENYLFQYKPALLYGARDSDGTMDDEGLYPLVDFETLEAELQAVPTL